MAEDFAAGEVAVPLTGASAEGPLVRIAPGLSSVSIWSPALFGEAGRQRLRPTLAAIFSVAEVNAIDIDRNGAFARIHFDADAQAPPESAAPRTWRRLAQALRQAPDAESLDRARDLFLDTRRGLWLRVNRIVGQADANAEHPSALSTSALSTWRLRFLNDRRIRLTHPLLFGRRDIAYRLEEELAALHGVTRFRANTLSASLVAHFDGRALNAVHLARELEKAWARVLSGDEGPASRKRLVAAAGLVAFAYTSQAVAPYLRPLAVLGLFAYGFQNILNALRQLARLHVGLPALYSASLILMLLRASPLNSTILALLAQFWPRLVFRTFVAHQRRLFSPYRRRAVQAHLLTRDGRAIDAHIDAIEVGDRVLVRAGEIVPVDGVIVRGAVRIAERALTGVPGLSERRIGDRVFAGARVHEGEVAVRVERAGSATAAAHIGATLPHTRFDRLPAAIDVERIANRNARPALLAAGASLWATGDIRRSQVIVRLDFVTAPRIGAQLSGLHALADALDHGIYFRNQAALDRIPATDIYVFDDSPALERHAGELAGIVKALKARNSQARFVHVSSRPQSQAAAAASHAGIDVVVGHLDSEGKADAIARLGPRTLWIGDGSLQASIAPIRASGASVSLAGIARVPEDAADIVLLDGEPGRLVALRRIARAHRKRIGDDYRAVYAGNAVGLAGGYLGPLQSFHVGIIANVVTTAVFAGHWLRLRRLTARVEEARRPDSAVGAPPADITDFAAEAPEPDEIEDFVPYAEVEASPDAPAEAFDSGGDIPDI